MLAPWSCALPCLAAPSASVPLHETYPVWSGGPGLKRNSRRHELSSDTYSPNSSCYDVVSDGHGHGCLCASSPSSAAVPWSDWLRESRFLGTDIVVTGPHP